ncbi:alkaline phosphatase [Niastella sp. OAS944]|uniref:alkaline phosphatase n=1 Tax=Niastella sp. OAS944 TaxID=2664089 RepID=UPI00347A9EDD|nr:alkaline phosphatase [Chitinophagaceae bacterium OAS944]
MKTLLLLLMLPCMHVLAQPAVYTTADAHSHNDYQQSAPFYSAYNLQYGSIEVDVYLSQSDNELYVAHTLRDVAQNRKFEEVYLKPLSEMIQKNNGNVYEDSTLKLILMLDVKTDAITSINKLIDLFMKYPAITKCSSLTIMVTGSKPHHSTYGSYPSFLWFDGLLSSNYSKEALSRIAVLGDNFINYSKWDGHEQIPPNDWEKLKKAVDKGHALGKKVRFWNTPDFIEGWSKLIELGVDYINTDSIKALAEFLKKNGTRKT